VRGGGDDPVRPGGFQPPRPAGQALRQVDAVGPQRGGQPVVGADQQFQPALAGDGL
jgi:hypothetical protein